MGNLRWYIITAASLILASVTGFAVQLHLFHRSNDTFFYLLQDLAFLPVQVLLVTLVVNRWFQVRERGELIRKTNMVVGIFFTEMGNTLLRYFSEFDTNLAEMKKIADIKPEWTDRDFTAMKKRVQQHEYTIDCRCADLNDLKRLLAEQREFILGLLANPGLLENAAFTELLWSISHLTQELSLRTDLNALPDIDYAHLAIDMRRAYVLLVQEWISYIRRLKETYPYIFSLMVRTDPFAPHPSAVIGEGITRPSG